MPERRFLVVRLGSLGDILHTLPAVAGLRESFPQARNIWLVDGRWRRLIECSALVDEIWTVNTRAWSSLRETITHLRRFKWDAAIDYQGLWKSALLPFFGGVSRRIGFDASTIREFGVPLLYTERIHVCTTHIADQNGELSLRAGARSGTASFTLGVAPEDITHWEENLRRSGLDRYIAICPGGGWRSKCWPAERYGELCRRINTELGLRCIVNYGPGEEDLAKTVFAASGDAKPILDGSALGNLMALLKRAALVVGGDTGPLHLAVALRTRVVGLYGPTDPARNGPYNTHEVVLRSPNAITDHRRRKEPDASILEISVDAVMSAVRQRLENPR